MMIAQEHVEKINMEQRSFENARIEHDHSIRGHDLS